MPRSLQSTAGLLTATAVAGITLGGLVGVLSALALGRFGGLGPRLSTLLVAGIGFVSVYAVPFWVYPPNPPAVGDPDTIGTRTVLYFTLVAISVVAAVAAVLVGRRLAARWGAWYAGLAAVGGYLLIMLDRRSLCSPDSTRCRPTSRPRCCTSSGPPASSPSSPCGQSSGSSWPNWCIAWCVARAGAVDPDPELAGLPG